jgi:hypothetical protein
MEESRTKLFNIIVGNFLEFRSIRLKIILVVDVFYDYC